MYDLRFHDRLVRFNVLQSKSNAFTKIPSMNLCCNVKSFSKLAFLLSCNVLIYFTKSEGNLHKIVELIFLIGTIVGPIITGLIIDHTRAYK